MPEVVTASQEELRKETLRKKHLFIAAPFFSVHERETVAKIEDVADANGVPFFSAMREPPNPLTPEQYRDPAVLNEVNQMCIKGINGSFAMLAWLDRILSVGDEVILVHRPKTIGNSERSGDRVQVVDGIVKKRNMVKTDDGVLWEMGYACCLGLPVIGFTLQNNLENVNPMISQNVLTIATGWDNLERLFHALAAPDAVMRVSKLSDEWNEQPKDFRMPPR